MKHPATMHTGPLGSAIHVLRADADIGVLELRRLHGRKGSRELRANFLALRAGEAPREFDASRVLAGLTPGDVCGAVDRVRLGVTHDERAESVTRIVRRRRRESVRVREEDPAPYSGAPEEQPDVEAHASS